MSENLQDKAVLVTLAISQWTAHKQDKAVGKAAADAFNVSDASAAGSYHKVLIAQEAIKKVSKVVNEVRTFHYENTLPWDDNGARLLPTANYLKYTQAIQEHKATFEAAVSELVSNYPSLVEEARARLNGMFAESDYPTPSKIRARYDFAVQVDPVPSSADFRITLQSEELDRIKADIESRVKEIQSKAMHDLWSRLYDAVSHMVERLHDPKAIFRDTLVSNIVDLVNLLPALNVAEDPDLESMRSRVESILAGLKAEDLREDKALRQETAKDAESILRDMQAYM